MVYKWHFYIVYIYLRKAWLANVMQDPGLDIREKAEDFSWPWFLPEFEKMAWFRREEGRVRGGGDSGYFREWLRIQALTA